MFVIPREDMDATSSFLLDKSLYPRRNDSSVPVFNGGGSNSVFLLGSASQRRLNIHSAGAGSLLSHPLPYAPHPWSGPTYSSLPNRSLLQPHYPPLLPLPVSKSLSLPPPRPLPSCTRIGGATTAAHSATKDQRKPRSPHVNPKKDLQRGSTRPQRVPPGATSPAKVLNSAAAVTSRCKDEKPEEEGGLEDGVYALSPPPSSLPMPKFPLRPRTPSAPASASCNAEACGSALLVGASDDLRRLLRL